MSSNIGSNEGINQDAMPTPFERVCFKADDDMLVTNQTTDLSSNALTQFRQFFDDDLGDIDDVNVFWKCIHSIKILDGATRDIFCLKIHFKDNEWFNDTTIKKHFWRICDVYCSKPVVLHWKDKDKDLSKGMLERAMAAYQKNTSDLRRLFTGQSFRDNPRYSMFDVLGYFNPQSLTDDVFPIGGELCARIRLFLDKQSCAFAREAPNSHADALDQGAESLALLKQAYCDKDLWQQNLSFCCNRPHSPIVDSLIAAVEDLPYTAADTLLHLVLLEDFCAFESDLRRIYLACVRAELLNYAENQGRGKHMIIGHSHGEKRLRVCGSKH